MEDPDYNKLNQEIMERALEQFLHPEDIRKIPVRWVLSVVFAVDDERQEQFYTLRSPNIAQWDALGLFEYSSFLLKHDEEDED